MKKLVAVILLLTAVGAVLVLKPKRPEPAAMPEPAATSVALPRLVELGADKCVPCKAMAPILAELKETYAGQLQVDFIDVWKNQDAGAQFGIRVIPTQVFIGSDGKELFRHEGFFSKEDILAKWKESGVELTASTPP